jgi:hypothetical protein
MEYRLANTLWCKCDNCVEIPTGKDCYCSCESAEISTSIVKGETMCITHHVAFDSIILGVDAVNMLRRDIISRCKSQEEKER